MYILTDGKRYVIKNPMRQDQYMASTSPVDAVQFEYKRAKTVLGMASRKSTRWLSNFYMVDATTKEEEKPNPKNKSKAGNWTGEKMINIDEINMDKIFAECDSIVGLAAWSQAELVSMKEKLEDSLSYVDSALSDAEHAIGNCKNPQAHKMAKCYMILRDLRQKHSKIKQCLSYVQVIENAMRNRLTLPELKEAVKKAKFTDYKARTDYYEMFEKLIGGR